MAALVYLNSSNWTCLLDQYHARLEATRGETMRRPEFSMTPQAARDFLAAAPAVTIAGSDPDGRPLLRTVNAVVLDDMLAFHGAPAGEKQGMVGREAVIAADEVVATLPSYFIDPRRACPATTLYRSVQLRGKLEPLADPALKARVLQALMEKYQPEGGHEPITAQHPLYRAAVAGLLVVGVPLAELQGKAKLGQNRKPAELVRVLEGLWQRGQAGDPRAIELVRAANPGTPAPDFLQGPAGATLHVWLDPAAAPAAAELLEGAYWNTGLGAERVARAHQGSPAWVGARDATGALVATARAIGDSAKHAWIYDVMVRPDWRGRGLGRALVKLLLDHPDVRGAAGVYLSTRDAQGVYAPLGFRDRSSLPPRPYPSTEMVLRR
jgi:nitroimidazol reductase NimA-like FMN-containing flavoprotein (pyridoxamine 5'-phosphate oxidase superfamily)/GNAT superfamily N-acetyltransferase